VVAARFGFTTAGLHSAVQDFRAGAKDFFVDARPGPKRAPGKDAARTRIVELRSEGYSIDEIAAVLVREQIALNRTGIAEVIAEAGLPRIWRRPEAMRGGPAGRTRPPRARALEATDLADLPADAPTRLAGLLLTLPDLSPWTCPPWSPRPATRAPATFPRSATC
jgi:hypothetical protein